MEVNDFYIDLDTGDFGARVGVDCLQQQLAIQLETAPFDWVDEDCFSRIREFLHTCRYIGISEEEAKYNYLFSQILKETFYADPRIRFRSVVLLGFSYDERGDPVAQLEAKTIDGKALEMMSTFRR